MFNKNIFYINSINLTICDSKVDIDLQIDGKKIKIDSIDPTYLWQVRLGHIWLERIKRSIKKGPLKSLQMGLLPICESYLEGKMIKRLFTENSTRATECLEHIHSDVCEPFKCPS